MAALPDFAATWDEAESHDAGRANLGIVASALRGDFDVEWPWHELTGYQFVFDTLRAAVGEAVNRLVAPADPILGYHAFNLALATAVIWLTYALVIGLGGSRVLGTFAALALALMPKFLAHSQSNPKDLVGLFVFTVTALLAVRAQARPTRARRLALAAGLGLALASHVLSAVLVPLLVVGAVAPSGDRRRCARDIGAVLVLSGFVAVACWPWLWGAPITRLGEAWTKAGGFVAGVDVLFLGRIYTQAQPPPSYLTVSLLASLPFAHLLALAAAAATARAGRHRPVLTVAVIWSGALLATELLARSRYDGVRHFLAILPALALLAALGLEHVWTVAFGLRGAAARRIVRGGIVVLLATVPLQLVRQHPYHDAYLNELATVIVPDGAERYLEVEYWGSPYREGARWLQGHAERGAVVVTPIGFDLARRHLEGHFQVVEGRRTEVLDPARPRYLMFITRVALYDDRIRRVEAASVPVFTVRRGNATLLKIYKLRAGAEPS